MPELYRVSVEPGHAPVQVLTTPALAARYNRAGDRIVYEDLKGYENLWRKHEKTSVTHDIWLYDVKTGDPHPAHHLRGRRSQPGLVAR